MLGNKIVSLREQTFALHVGLLSLDDTDARVLIAKAMLNAFVQAVETICESVDANLPNQAVPFPENFDYRCPEDLAPYAGEDFTRQAAGLESLLSPVVRYCSDLINSPTSRKSSLSKEANMLLRLGLSRSLVILQQEAYALTDLLMVARLRAISEKCSS